MSWYAVYNSSNSTKVTPKKLFVPFHNNSVPEKIWIATIKQEEGTLPLLYSNHFQEACSDKNW